jgi:membrane protein DedA with SNARE-associated domain
MVEQVKEQEQTARDPWRDRRNQLIAVLVVGAIILIGRLTPFKPVQNVFGIFGWVTETALDITRTLFEDYGYMTAFLAPMLENTIFLGAIIPGTLVMLLAGLSAEQGLIRLQYAIPLAILGAWIGDTLSYGIGRFGFSRLGPESRIAKWSEEMREPLLEHTGWLVLLYHFAGYSRMIGPSAAGFLRVPFRRWIVLDYAGAALWVIVFMSLGYILGLFGLSLDSTESNVRVVELILFGLAAVGIVFVITRASRRKIKEEIEEVAEA